MQPAASCIRRPAYRRMQAAYGRNKSDMQAASNKSDMQLRLEKYNLHFENAIDGKPAWRLHVAQSVANSAVKQLSIPGCSLHASLVWTRHYATTFLHQLQTMFK